MEVIIDSSERTCKAGSYSRLVYYKGSFFSLSDRWRKYSLFTKRDSVINCTAVKMVDSELVCVMNGERSYLFGRRVFVSGDVYAIGGKYILAHMKNGGTIVYKNSDLSELLRINQELFATHHPLFFIYREKNGKYGIVNNYGKKTADAKFDLIMNGAGCLFTVLSSKEKTIFYLIDGQSGKEFVK